MRWRSFESDSKTGESFDTIPFFRPDGFVEGTHLAKAILAYKVDPRADSGFAPNADFHIAMLGVPAETVHKVKVGDRLDGGRVSAIGDGELRYQKGGRNIVLQMPRG